MNATVTVAYGGHSVTFELDGDELSADSTGHKSYLNNASKGYIADEVEKALLALTAPTTGSPS
jgi:hypothetical protein